MCAADQCALFLALKGVAVALAACSGGEAAAVR